MWRTHTFQFKSALSFVGVQKGRRAKRQHLHLTVFPMSKEHGPKTIKLGFSYKEILKRKAEQGDKRAKQVLKELGPNRGVFDNYNS